MIRAALAAALALALAACASTAAKPNHPPDSLSAPDRRGLMVDVALSMLGQPYRYGGAAPGGFDCSGLVAYAASGAGLRVPRTAWEQANIGAPVARSDLRAGDLVFMHMAHKELHVGIAVDGERFVHAPSKGGSIRIDSLAAPPYARSFISARRIVASP